MKNEGAFADYDRSSLFYLNFGGIFMKNSDVKQKIRSIWGFKNSIMATLAFLLYTIVTIVLSVTGIGAIVAPVLGIGYASLWLNMVRNDGKVEFKRIFTDSFSNVLKKWVLNFLIALFTGLWSLLLIIPGIVKAYSYAMAPYIMLDNPEISAMDAIKQSQKMMSGYKKKLFFLDLSFLPACLLAPLTLGILYLDIIPRRAASHAAFYEELKKVTAEAPAQEAAEA